MTIADQLRAGIPLRDIATALGRSPSTISREIARNRDPVNGQYRPFTAQHLAAARRPRPKRRKLADPQLRDYVQYRLEEKWSPEQIARTLPSAFPTARSCTWPTRPSTRLSTCRDVASCAAN